MTRERDDMLRAAQAERNGSGVELPQKESEEAERAIMSALQMGTEAEKEVNNVEEEEPEPESANLDVLSAARARRAALMAAQRNETPAAVHAAARRALESIDEMNESNHMAMDELPNLSLTQAREVAHQMAIALAGDPIEVERTLLIAIRKDSLEPLDAILHVASSSLGIKRVDEIAAAFVRAHFAAGEKPALQALWQSAVLRRRKWWQQVVMHAWPLPRVDKSAQKWRKPWQMAISHQRFSRSCRKTY